MKNLTPNVRTARISAPVAAGTTNIDCTVVDTQGFDGVCAIAHLGTLTAGQATRLIAIASDNADGSSGTQVAATDYAADADSGKLLILEVCELSTRYILFRVERATQNAVLNSVIAISFRPSIMPVDTDATVSDAELVVSPDLS